MCKKNIFFLTTLIFILESCSTLQEVKRGLSGEKVRSTDEFLVKKKDPLILPPNYSDLPTPEKIQERENEISIFQTGNETNSSAANSSTEQSILNKIRKK